MPCPTRILRTWTLGVRLESRTYALADALSIQVPHGHDRIRSQARNQAEDVFPPGWPGLVGQAADARGVRRDSLIPVRVGLSLRVDQGGARRVALSRSR